MSVCRAIRCKLVRGLKIISEYEATFNNNCDVLQHAYVGEWLSPNRNQFSKTTWHDRADLDPGSVTDIDQRGKFFRRRFRRAGNATEGQHRARCNNLQKIGTACYRLFRFAAKLLGAPRHTHAHVFRDLAFVDTWNDKVDKSHHIYLIKMKTMSQATARGCQSMG